jgi:hypothetical protein
MKLGWSYDEYDIEYFATVGKSWLFKNKIRKRLRKLKDYYERNPDEAYDDYTISSVLSEIGMPITFIEHVDNEVGRRFVIGYVFLLYLLLANPMGM